LAESDLLVSILPENIEELVLEKAQEFQQNYPYSYVVLDNFLDAEIAELLASQIPTSEDSLWQHINIPDIRKAWVIDGEQLPEDNRQLFLQFNSLRMLRFIEQLSGCKGILPDPYLLSIMVQQPTSGFERLHADTNYHGILKLYRRFGCLLYLTKDWKEEYGGCLELWDSQLTQPVQKIVPAFNRLVIYTFGKTAYHNITPVVSTPNGLVNQYIALAYCSNEPPAGEEPFFHNYLWQERPDLSADYSLEAQPPAQKKLQGQLARVTQMNNYLLEQLGKAIGKRDATLDHERNMLIHRVASLEQRQANLKLNINRLTEENSQIETELQKLGQYNQGLGAQAHNTETSGFNFKKFLKGKK